jgi:hypothetical protein
MTRHPEGILVPPGQFETCPDWVGEMDSNLCSRKRYAFLSLHRLIKVIGLDHSLALRGKREKNALNMTFWLPGMEYAKTGRFPRFRHSPGRCWKPMTEGGRRGYPLFPPVFSAFSCSRPAYVDGRVWLLRRFIAANARRLRRTGCRAPPLSDRGTPLFHTWSPNTAHGLPRSISRRLFRRTDRTSVKSGCQRDFACRPRQRSAGPYAPSSR